MSFQSVSLSYSLVKLVSVGFSYLQIKEAQIKQGVTVTKQEELLAGRGRAVRGPFTYVVSFNLHRTPAICQLRRLRWLKTFPKSQSLEGENLNYIMETFDEYNFIYCNIKNFTVTQVFMWPLSGQCEHKLTRDTITDLPLLEPWLFQRIF